MSILTIGREGQRCTGKRVVYQAAPAAHNREAAPAAHNREAAPALGRSQTLGAAARLPLRRGISSMPRALPRCAGCDSFCVALVHVLGDRRRCRQCHKDKAVWQCCSLGWCRPQHQMARCVPLRRVPHGPPTAAMQAAAVGKRACPACVFAFLANTLKVLPGTHPLERTGDPAALMSPVHLTIVHVEVHIWVLPRRDRCIYYVVRIILWRRFGVFLGVLPGLNHNGNRHAIGQHITKLKKAKLWPRTDAPVVIIGVEDDRHLPRVQALTKPERARLKAFGDTLSRQANTRGLDWTALNLTPGAAAHASVPLVQTCAEMLESIGLTTNGRPGNGRVRPWNANTDEERAFRRSLHTSTAALFRWP